MRNLSLNTGIKEYMINNDENKVISVNTADINIASRAEQAQKNIEAIQAEYKNKTNTPQVLSELDLKIREQIDYIFGSRIADVAFGNINCLSLAGGQPIFQNFLDAILPEIKKDLTQERKKSENNIKKYTNQVKQYDRSIT